MKTTMDFCSIYLTSSCIWAATFWKRCWWYEMCPDDVHSRPNDTIGRNQLKAWDVVKIERTIKVKGLKEQHHEIQTRIEFLNRETFYRIYIS